MFYMSRRVVYSCILRASGPPQDQSRHELAPSRSRDEEQGHAPYTAVRVGDASHPGAADGNSGRGDTDNRGLGGPFELRLSELIAGPIHPAEGRWSDRPPHREQTSDTGADGATDIGPNRTQGHPTFFDAWSAAGATVHGSWVQHRPVTGTGNLVSEFSLGALGERPVGRSRRHRGPATLPTL